MILDLIPENARSAGLGALMKGAGFATRYVPIPQPTLLVGPGSSERLGQAIAGFGHRRTMVVTDEVVCKLGLLDALTRGLTGAGAKYVVFDQITPDAPIPLIERGMAFFHDNDCDSIVAVGGGSSMDASKAIAAAIANPGKSLRALAGYFKGLRTPMPIYAVPTTAGTGSEVTVAAVIADPEEQSKLVIVDTRLVPRMAALDPTLMTGLPPPITAATGIDALTHAVEAFIGRWANEYTDSMALAAVGMIFANLRTAYADGRNLAAREAMALAATYAGIAFTRANVGYVHAIAHQFGGRYHTPHGLANAIMLPHVLRFSRGAAVPQLARLAHRTGVAAEDDNDDESADKFLDAVETLNRDLDIPTHLEALKEADIPDLARAALREAHGGYPVPRYMTQAQCETMIRAVLPARAEFQWPPAKKAARSPQPAAKSPQATKTQKTSKTPKVTKMPKTQKARGRASA